MKVIFMGTPDFAVDSLMALINADDIVVQAVVTQPDKPVGRGMITSIGPIKTVALEHNIPVYQPASLKDDSIFSILSELDPDFLVVVAYGKILPDRYLALAKYGAINVHGSLLPKYRGAAPIQWAVLNGDDFTGVTTMYLAHDMDTGDIIYKDTVPISEYMTSGQLSDILKCMGADLLMRTLRDVYNNVAPRTKQNDSEASYVKMLDKTLSPVDWNDSQKSIIRQIYGLQPWPVASADIGGIQVKIFDAEYTDTICDKSPGTILNADKKGIEIVCGDSRTVLITRLQAPGKKVVSAADYINGHKLL